MTPQTRLPENVISLNWIWVQLWSRRLLIAATTTVGLLVSIAVTAIQDPSYDVSMMVVPTVSDTDTSGLLGGQLPSFLGGSDSQPVSKFKQFQVALFSSNAAALMDRKYGALCEINERCDFPSRKWRPRPAWRVAVSGLLRTMMGMPATPPEPEVEDLVAYIRKNVSVANDKSVVTLSMKSRKPEQAKNFLIHLVQATNDYIKSKDSVALEQYVKYLSDRIDHLDSVSQRDPLTSLLMTEERRLMLTHVNVPYAATPFDGPATQAVMPLVVYGMGVGAGALFGILLAFALQLGWIGGGRSTALARSSHRQYQDA